MALEEILPQVEARMKKAIDAWKHELASVRTGRAAPSLVEELEVDAYGAATPLVSLAAISAPEPRQIVIQPWDRNLIKAIEKAILASDLGLTPGNDGAVIRLNIPALNEERRKDLVKQLHKKVEEGRVEIRTLRRHAHDELKSKEKSSGVTTDETKSLVEDEVKLRVIGRLGELSDRLQKAIAGAVQATSGGTRGVMTLAFNYGGRAEIVDAVKRLVADGVAPGEVDEGAIAKRLYAPDHPDPDLLIRTGGELRVSNFLLWEVAYSEMWATQVLWPDFSVGDLDAALASHAERERRFGR